MATLLYFDLLSGASGDMILGALVDLGVPVKYLNRELGRLAINGLSVGSSKVDRNGIMCVKMVMRWDAPGEYRHLRDIVRLIKKAEFNPSIRERCEAVLDRIATAEAMAHGIPKDRVHFHEIGAVDTIVDIVGACLALDYLKIDEILFSSLTEGHGTIVTEHGILPVPAPATAALCKGFHCTRLPIPSELLTPTGAALLTTLGRQALVCPAGRVIGNGNGCGSRVFKEHPNFLRATLISVEAEKKHDVNDTVTCIETDMDHISGEIMGTVAALLMDSGSLDVSWTPLFMKKGRPGYRLTVIAPPKKTDALIDLIMVHTRTLGVRFQTMRRVTADREARPGTLDGRRIREKACRYKGHSFSKAEHDDLAKISLKEGVPVVELAERYCREKNGVKSAKIRR
jgi:pyridinium-3,5-bisthiocarboxylic acid mononucleotide nickel chelatase